MIKRALYSLILVATMLGMTMCEKRAIIPDETLADIFHDAFLVNAYIGEEHINIDSLSIYEPIFKKYGYTTEDVLYTVSSFSRRKSVQLGSIVDTAIKRLERESKEYDRKVVILDTIRNVALRSFKREIYRDTLISAKKRADSTKLQIVINPAPRGEYNIIYNYTCGDDLEKYPRRAEFYFTDENGFHIKKTMVTMRESGAVNRTLVTDEDRRSLVVVLGKYTDLDKSLSDKDKKSGKKPRPPKSQDLEIRDFKIIHKLKEKEAIDSLFLRYVDVKIFADGFLVKKDSLALSPDTTRVSTTTATND